MAEFRTQKAFSEAIRYVFGGATWAQAILLATQRLLGLENRKILKAATGLGGGIGHEGDTCGALTGGVLSLGLYHQDNDCNRLWPDCIEYYRKFNTRFGSSKCRDITGIKFKEGYDIRRFLLKGMKCLRLVYTSIESIVDIVEMAEWAWGQTLISTLICLSIRFAVLVR